MADQRNNTLPTAVESRVWSERQRSHTLKRAMISVNQRPRTNWQSHRSPFHVSKRQFLTLHLLPSLTTSRPSTPTPVLDQQGMPKSRSNQTYTASKAASPKSLMTTRRRQKLCASPTRSPRPTRATWWTGRRTTMTRPSCCLRATTSRATRTHLIWSKGWWGMAETRAS